MTDTKTQIQEAQRIPNRTNNKKFYTRPYLNCSKLKTKKILKEARGK